MKVASIPLAGLALLLAGPAGAETCSGPDRPRSAKAKRSCAPPARFEPYDPDRPRPGRTPGFTDIGNGTEVRVDGRARMEYGTRR